MPLGQEREINSNQDSSGIDSLKYRKDGPAEERDSKNKAETETGQELTVRVQELYDHPPSVTESTSKSGHQCC